MSTQPLSNPFSDDRLTGADIFNPELDVESLHAAATSWLERAIDHATKVHTPDGQGKIAILRGTPGFGKTHVLGRLAHRCHKKALFIFVPQMEEHGSPVDHIHWHILRRLFDAHPGKRPLMHILLARLCQRSFCAYFDFLPYTVKAQHQTLRDRLDNDPLAVLDVVKEAKDLPPYLALGDSIASQFPALRAEIVRGLALAWSPRANEAWCWLRGDQLADAQLDELMLPDERPTTSDLVRTITVLLKRLDMSLVLCCDQSEGFLRKRDETEELRNALVGWLDTIPNLVLVLTLLYDTWKNLDAAGFSSFLDRSKPLDLDHLDGRQAVDLLRRRLVTWPGARPEKGLLWPFREADVVKFAQAHPLDARGLLKRCAASLESWLAKSSDQELGLNGEDEKRPLEDLFRQEWIRSLEALRKEELDPNNVQEERLFRSVREVLNLLHESHTPVGGLELLQMQDGAVRNHHSLQLKLGVKGSSSAFPVVVALTKLTGGRPLGTFLNALQEAVKGPVAGAVLVRSSSELTLGPKTDARKVYDDLKKEGKLRPFELPENRNAFEQMECWLRILDRAGQKDLQLDQQAISRDECRQLAIKTQIFTGLNLLEKICCGWPQASAAAAAGGADVSGAAAASASGAAGASAGASASPTGQRSAASGAQQTQTGSGPAGSATGASSGGTPGSKEGNSTGGDSWAEKLLAAVTEKLIEFGQKVDPIDFQVGPTFVRLRLKPLGRTSIGRVRNHASDLRAHIAAIPTVPVIADQPGYISVDVQRQDRQTVSLTDCLSTAPAKLAGQPAFPVGVDVTGHPHWLNLAEPSACHILAAGTTGSGKSEFLKAMLAGLAARLSPLDLRFILVDPKHVTFNFSGNSPYFLHPVAHTVEEAVPLVQWCFAETERRYELLQQRGLEHVGQLKGKDVLPRIVVVFDEFADLMADRATRKDLETSLKRIGALARAAGIHLVLATQRPDKDVVTPLLKANLPTRVCLHVDGERNSKIILDEEGGENLLGHGDLFWKHGGGMVRLQGPFVEKAELETYLKLEQ